MQTKNNVYLQSVVTLVKREICLGNKSGNYIWTFFEVGIYIFYLYLKSKKAT